MLERSRTSSPVQVRAPCITGTGRGCAPARTAASSKGPQLDPSSHVDPGPLPRDWHPAHHPLLSSSTTASMRGDSGQPQLKARRGQQRWPEMLGQLSPGQPLRWGTGFGRGAQPGWAAGRELPRDVPLGLLPPAWGLSCHINSPRVQKNPCLQFGILFRRSSPSAQLRSLHSLVVSQTQLGGGFRLLKRLFSLSSKTQDTTCELSQVTWSFLC